MVPNEAPIVAGTPADDAFNVTVTTPEEPEFLDDPAARQQNPQVTTGPLAPIVAGAAAPQGTAAQSQLRLPLPTATQPAQAFPGTTQPAGTPAQTLGERSLAAVGPGGQSAVMPGPGMNGTPTASVTAALAPNTAPGGQQPARIATVDNADSEKAYNDAFALLKAGQYDQAIVALRTFLAQYPASQYVDNAQYWLGESFYVLRQYEAAIAEYQKLLQLYPDSQKFSHALLKIGYSYDELGQRDLARSTLQELTDNFPSTTAARLAAERITRIRVESMR
jgi:tol-pal system protein YbgF